MARKKITENEVISLSSDLHLQEITASVLGVTPFVCNAMSNKAKHWLLMPPSRKNRAEKATSLKHDPITEFRSSIYRTSNERAPTAMEIVANSFKRAIESVALDIPGATKSQIVRNLVVPESRTFLYGIPEMLMSVTRSSDMSRTPDIRTRAIVPNWACYVTIRFPYPLFMEKSVSKYLALAGQLRGVGDYRAEKGAGSYGLFDLVPADDPRFLSIISSGGRDAQLAALESPAMYDDETRELFDWFNEELTNRGTESMRNGKKYETELTEYESPESANV